MLRLRSSLKHSWGTGKQLLSQPTTLNCNYLASFSLHTQASRPFSIFNKVIPNKTPEYATIDTTQRTQEDILRSIDGYKTNIRTKT